MAIVKQILPKISYEEAWDFLIRKVLQLKLINAMNFSNMKIIAPELNIYKDQPQFYDPAHNEIHIGTDGLVDIFTPEDKEELYNATLFIQGHEEQHKRSTASVPYARAIKRGVQQVLQYIASIESPKRKFRSDKDYDDFLFELKDKGIVLNIDGIFEIVRHIANSIEDGRIERIRSNRLPGFANLRLYFRGKNWMNAKPKKPYAEVKGSAIKRLEVLTGEILSLATCQLYSKGFLKAYGTTPILDEVRQMMPDIAGGVMSGSVKGAEKHIINLSSYLAPYIYEAFKLSEKDLKAMEELKKMLADLISSMIDASPEDMNLDERDEDTDEGGADSTFPHSDLEITLPDEVYDKLMEKRKEEKSSSGGINIRREHPKEKKEEESDEKSGNSAGSEGTKKENKSEAKYSSGKNAEEKSEESANGGDSESENSGSTSKSKDSGSSSEPQDENHSGKSTRTDSGSDGEGKNSDKNKSEASGETSSKDASTGSDTRKEWKSEKGKSKTTNSDDGESDEEEAVRSILKAIEDTKEMVREIAKEEIGRINEQSAHEKKEVGKPVYDTDPPLTHKDVKSEMEGTGFSFKEVKRTYKVDTDLPPVIAARGKALHRKMEKYFRSLHSPNIHNLDSGSLDPARVFGLALGDTDVFRKRGKSKFFDGCAYILIDNSGSMWGQKFDEACAAAAIIEEGFKGLFPIKIVSFNDNCRTVLHQVVKGWDESLPKNCSWNYRVHSHPDNGNADGCSINVAAKELSARPEKKKLLVVLSDGAPTEGGRNPVKLTEDAIANARKKHIQVSGIYFEVGEIGPDADTFKQCYKRDYVCVPLSELDKNLERIFEKFSRS